MTNTRRRLQVGGLVWFFRFVLAWLLVYPVYATLAASPTLHGSNGDRAVFVPGSEQLTVLIFSRLDALASMGSALLLLTAVIAGLAALASSVVWVALDERLPLFGAAMWRTVRRILPAFGCIALGTAAFTWVNGWLWWHAFPLFGALLEPWLGERGTDLAQLGLVAGVVAFTGLLWILADLLRSIIYQRRERLLEALPAAVDLYRSRPLDITWRAAGLFVVAMALELGCACAIQHFGWLRRSTGHTLLALLVGELTAFLVLSLRLAWIQWIRSAARWLAPNR